MDKAVTVVVAISVVVVAFPLIGYLLPEGKEPLTSEDQQVWDRFLSKRFSSEAVTPSEEDANQVAAMGDKIAPYIEEQFGAAARVPRTYGKSEYWLHVVLGRIGTPQAIDAIVKVLEHDWQGAVGTNGETSARALVWLGAQDRIPGLEVAIVAHDRLVAENDDPLRYASEVENLKKYLALLRKGEGIRDKSGFPFGPSLIDRSVEFPFPAERIASP